MKWFWSLGISVLTLSSLCLSAQEEVEASKSTESESSSLRDISAYDTRYGFLGAGIATMRDGKWVGGDNFLNLGKSIRVVVEYIQPSDSSFPLDSEDLRKQMEARLVQGGISPFSKEADALLPFLHAQVLIFPIEKAFIIQSNLRLMEKATLSRVELPQQIVWQVPTWEKRRFLLVSEKEAEESLKKAIMGHLELFLKRYEHHEGIRKFMERGEAK